MTGVYSLDDMQPCILPGDVAVGFNQVVGNLPGAEYVPVLYVGQQAVAGINHMIICRQKIMASGVQDSLVEVVINHAVTTGTWSLVSISRIA